MSQDSAENNEKLVVFKENVIILLQLLRYLKSSTVARSNSK